MNWIIITIAVIAGIFSSLIYFGGLWMTLRKIAKHKLSYSWILASFIVRLAIVMCIFYLLLTEHWAYMSVALVSFLIVRQLLMARIGKSDQSLAG